jgi:hypothetical protein
VIERLRKWSLTRRHPRPQVLSQYLEGELGTDDLRALEAHLKGCADCRGLLDSLADTVRSLGSLRQESPASVADSVIAALRADDAAPTAAREPSSVESDQPALALVPESVPPSARGLRLIRRSRAKAVLRYCLRRRQLRLTLPIALIAGVLLSLINQGGMLFDGRVDLGMCAMCAMNFVVPFIVLNVGVLMVVRRPGQGNR